MALEDELLVGSQVMVQATVVKHHGNCMVEVAVGDSIVKVEDLFGNHAVVHVNHLLSHDLNPYISWEGVKP